MTPARSRRAVSLGALTVVFAAVLAVYVGAFAIYVALRLERSASRLDPRSDAIPQFFAALTEFAQTMNQGVARSYDPVPADRPARLRQAAELRSLVLAAPNRATPGLFAGIPDAMRMRLARADERAASLQIALLDYASLIELDRLRAAERRRASVGILAAELQALVADAERAAVHDLVERQRDLRSAAQFANRAVAWWLLGGGVLLAVGLGLLARRVLRPLRELEGALDRVANGDLTARIAVQRTDELGRLQEHFNRTSEVLEQRAHDQGRFVAAGELLAGIAHEVNNPLMAIAATAEERLAGDLLEAGERQEYVTILRQARRAGKLMSGLLRFVRPKDDQLMHVDVSAVAREALDLVSYRFPHHQVELVMSLPADLPRARVQASRLEQVLVNLVSNAVDALKTVPPPRRVAIHSSASASHLRITVEDNGPGIAPDMAGRLFQPFATSKGDLGTGLGLYISRELIRSAGGELSVEPLTVRGTRFVVVLPVAADPAPLDPTRAAPAPAVPILAGTRVLLVDDEAAIRAPVGRYLRRRGAVVAEAGNGVEALEHLVAHPVDVVIADVRMPLMDGPALYAVLEQRHPELAARLLFLSGDISQLGGLANRPGLADRIVVKPVDLPVLESAVARLLATVVVLSPTSGSAPAVVSP